MWRRKQQQKQTFFYQKYYIQMRTSSFECECPHNVGIDEQKQFRPNPYYTDPFLPYLLCVEKQDPGTVQSCEYPPVPDGRGQGIKYQNNIPKFVQIPLTRYQ